MQEIFGESMGVKYCSAYLHHIPNMKHLPNRTISGGAVPCGNVRMHCPIDFVRTRRLFVPVSLSASLADPISFKPYTGWRRVIRI